jgi:pimeloyl-ACP methyl ester carboxylesterase
VIDYREYGSGPGLILVHGGMKAAQHFSKLAGALGGDFRVYVPDRRGRGMSGPHGEDFSVRREVEDMQALIAATRSRFIFGLSSGALVSLRTALFTTALERVALYEPPLSVNGSAPTAWVPRYDREVAAGQHATALITALKGTGVEPVLGRLPRFLLAPIFAVGLRAETKRPGEVTIADLIPTQHFDMRIVQEMADTAPEYAQLQARVLLLGGTKSPDYLSVALNELAAVLPHAQQITLPDLTHEGPEDDGRPLVVAQALRDFFTAP